MDKFINGRKYRITDKESVDVAVQAFLQDAEREAEMLRQRLMMLVPKPIPAHAGLSYTHTQYRESAPEGVEQSLIDNLVVDGRALPDKDFVGLVAMLQRPYLPVSEETYSAIETMTESSLSDIVVWEGKLCTFGSADRGYALMPIREEYVNDLTGVQNG